MELNQQLQVLKQDAVKYGIAPIVIEKAIAPILESLARELQHLEYYIQQNLQEDWIVFVISNRLQSQIPEKKVIYAFSTVQDSRNFSMVQERDSLLAIPLPTIQILFRLISLQQIDSIIFFNQSGNTSQGIEVKRRDLQAAIEQQLLKLKTTPPDIA